MKFIYRKHLPIKAKIALDFETEIEPDSKGSINIDNDHLENYLLNNKNPYIPIKNNITGSGKKETFREVFPDATEGSVGSQNTNKNIGEEYPD